MRAITTSAGLLVAVFGLIACDSAPQGSPDTNRKRLGVNNSYAEFGQYAVHVNAMTTDSLLPDVAKNYGIVRSGSQGLVNLVILRNSQDVGVSQPISGKVTSSVANLTGQVKQMDLQEIRDGESIYYIGVVSVNDRETINFDFDIRPEGSNQNLAVRYSYQFYTN